MAEFQTIIEERERMCNAHGSSCDGCPLSRIRRKSETICTLFMIKDPKEAEIIIMKWAEEHPLVTNGAKFEEVFGVPFWAISCGVTPEISKWLRSEYKEPEKQKEERT